MWSVWLLAAVAFGAPKTGWTTPSPYAEPILGASAVSVDGATFGQVTGGLAAGFRTRYRGGTIPWANVTRAQATGTLGIPSGSLGGDLRGGTFFGPRWKVLQLQHGPDVFYNGYGEPGARDFHIPWAPGVALVNAATIRVVPKVLALRFDVVPGWVFSAERQAADLGPISEATAGASISLNAGPIGLTLGARRYWNVVGQYDTFTFGASL